MNASATRIAGNPGSAAREAFATLTLTEASDRIRSFEVAAWSSTVRVEAGTYTLTTNGYWVLGSLPGMVIDEYTPSLYGGVPFGTNPQGKNHSNVGKESSYPIQSYLYSVLGQIVEHDGVFLGGTLTLADGYTIEGREVETSDGRTFTHYDLYKVA